MSCSDWPPPLPSLPIPPPCPPPKPPPKKEIKIINSVYQEWWDAYLSDVLRNASGHKKKQKSPFYELTKRQRRDLLSIEVPSKTDKLIWSIPLPKGAYPPNGLPIWERLYLDRRLPMLTPPPNALVFARQQIGKKLYKDTEGQEFILYDPHNYEVIFSYENVHDPNLSDYYQGEAIRGFLLSLGDANEEGWGICTLRRFNKYRQYLRRVHLSRVHKEMQKQEALQEEIHNVNTHLQTTKDTLDLIEKKATQEEATAALKEAQRQYQLQRVDRILDAIKEKEERVERLYQKREEDQEARRQKGLELHAQQELKNKIAKEIGRRKKIATLRRWHDVDEKLARWRKKTAEDRKRQKAERVRLRWQNKIEYLRKMIERDDEYLKLQNEIKEKNVEIRNKYVEHLKKKEADRLQELKKRTLEKKSQQKRAKTDKRMEKAITDTWLDVLKEDFDMGIELYRVKKSINSTMATLSTQPMEGPDRLSIISMARNRIEREQSIPIQVSFALDALLETTIEMWAKIRINCMLETIAQNVKKEGHERLEEIKTRCKNIFTADFGDFKSTQPIGTVFKPDEERREPEIKMRRESESSDTSQRGTERRDESSQTSTYSKEVETEITRGAMTINYVHIGPVTQIDSPYDPIPPENLKSVQDRPKTPMPTPEILCKAVFEEEELQEILPTITGDVMDLKEKRKFRKTFKNVSVQLCKRINALAELSYEPSSRLRAINKLVPLGNTSRATMVDVLCGLIMSKPEKQLFESEEFEWLVQVLARETVDDVLKPPLFQHQQDDGVARTKIMFYKPKPKIKKSN